MTNNTLLLYYPSPYHKQAREQYLTPLSTGIVTLQTKRKGTPGRSRNRGLTPVSILFMAVKYQLVQMRDMSSNKLCDGKIQSPRLRTKRTGCIVFPKQYIAKCEQSIKTLDEVFQANEKTQKRRL